MAAAVAQCEREVRFATFLRLDLLGNYDEARRDDLVLVAYAIADVEVLHGGAVHEYKRWRPPGMRERAGG
jgi:hypothetical protein